MSRPARKIAFIAFTIVILLQTGCVNIGLGRSEPSRYYILQPITDVQSEMVRSASGQGMALGIEPITLPGYLDRPQIVTRISQQELAFAEFDKWSESLQINATRVLAENLSLLAATEQVVILPVRRSFPIDYRITVEFIQFEVQRNGPCHLSARWRVFSKRKNSPLIGKKSEINEPVKGPGYSEMVAAMSRALFTLSREIATAFDSLANR